MGLSIGVLALAGIALGTAPGNLFATALPLTDSGILDLANSSINLVGVTTFPSPYKLGGGSTCGVLTTHLMDVAGVSNLFNSALPGTIMDLSTVPPPVVPDRNRCRGGCAHRYDRSLRLGIHPANKRGSGFWQLRKRCSKQYVQSRWFSLFLSGELLRYRRNCLVFGVAGCVHRISRHGFHAYNATFQTTQTQTLNGSGACSGIAATITNILACEGASGTIAATWSATEGPQPLVMTGTPEPATLVLFGSGLLAVGFIGRRRFRRD